MKEITSQKTYEERISRILITEEEIAAAVKKAGRDIDALYDGHPILLVSILKGSFVFLADLARAVTVPCEIGFMCAKSYYEGTTSTGVVKITMDLDRNIENYHVIIVEDIVDTGESMEHLLRSLAGHRPASVEIATLLFKPSKFSKDYDVKYRALEIPNDFIVGFGLDYDELGRNLKDIYTVVNE